MTKAMQRLEVVLAHIPDHENVIRELFRQHGEEIIGNDEGEGSNDDPEGIYNMFRNGLRKEQRERAAVREF